jgi:hypothetical protein
VEYWNVLAVPEPPTGVTTIVPSGVLKQVASPELVRNKFSAPGLFTEIAGAAFEHPFASVAVTVYNPAPRFINRPEA